ncbi:MAG: hypothetical protein AAGB31_04790 [Bdellovibrio sp.]
MLLSAATSFAQEEVPEETTNPPLVRVELRQDILAPYKERRDNHGLYLAFDYEVLNLKNYVSTLDGLSYGEMFGESEIPLLRASIDYKYNMSLGSLAVGLDYAQGELSQQVSGVDRTLSVTRYGVGLKYVADMIADEPYVAPYIGINFWQMDLSETSPTDSFSGTTQIGYNYTLGLMVQLNWLDPATAQGGAFAWGLENTFLDLYITQYAQTSDSTDPNTETDLLYGAGLRLEF